MRCLGILVIALVLGTPSLLVSQGPEQGWALHLGFARESFSGASTDTITIPGTRVDVTPTPRLAVELGAGRRLGTWEVSLWVGYAGGGLRAETSDIVIEDRTGGVDRYRGVLRIGREVTRLDAARVILEGGLALDYWEVTGIGRRTTLAGQAGIRLRVPLGQRLALENSALFTLGGSPFAKSALPAGASVSTLKTWSLGIGLRRGW